MAENNVRERIDIILIDLLALDKAPKSEEHLYNDLGMDSLDAVELITKIEEEFKIEISDEQLEEIKTVGDVTKMVNTFFE